MIAFPLDNVRYLASALGAWFATRTRGVFSADTHYSVAPNGDMSITLSPGIAWLKADAFWGVCMHEINHTVLPLETADGVLTRYAAVCIQLDKNQNEPRAVVKYGPYGTNPTLSSLPLPVQNSLDYDEVYVAAIRIRAGATSILSTDITDLRLNESYCGVMRDGVTGIPTQALYDAWWSWFSALKLDTEQRAAVFTSWMETFRNENEASLAAWLDNFKNTSMADFSAWFGAFKTDNTGVYNSWYSAFVSTSETSFSDWFQHLQDELDENQATNLQRQIDDHKATLATAAAGAHGVRYKDGKLQIALPDGWATLARVVWGLGSAYIDALNLTSVQIDALGYTSTQIDNLIEMEA